MNKNLLESFTMQHMTPAEKFTHLIKTNIYRTTGSVGSDGVPWVTPLYYAYDEQLNLYWISPKDSWHSKNIQHNSNTSFTCFDSHAPKWTGNAAYMTLTVKELASERDIARALTYIFHRLDEPVPNSQEFSNNATYRTYQAKPKGMWVTGSKKIAEEIIDDARIEVNIEDVIRTIQLNDIFTYGKKQGKKSGIKPNQVESVIDEYRQGK